MLNKALQILIGIEHEGVDANVVLRAAHGFAQGRLNSQLLSLVTIKVCKPWVTLRGDVSRRFTVGDHDDLLIASLTTQHFASLTEGVMHVGTLHARQ